MVRMVAEQAHLVDVFRTPLDVVVARQSSVREPCAKEMIEPFQSTLDALGTVSLTVWVQEDEGSSAGIWKAAMDAWSFGSCTWPV